MPAVLKYGRLILLEHSGPVQAYNGIALPLPLPVRSVLLPPFPFCNFVFINVCVLVVLLVDLPQDYC